MKDLESAVGVGSIGNLDFFAIASQMCAHLCSGLAIGPPSGHEVVWFLPQAISIMRLQLCLGGPNRANRFADSMIRNRFKVPELNPLFCESRFGGGG